MFVNCAYDRKTDMIKNAKLSLGSYSFPNDIWCNNKNLCLYDHAKGKFAEIISDEVKEPLFKVGDRPKWTPELIKQLPHGTVLECAVYGKNFTHTGHYISSQNDKVLIVDKYFSPTESAFFTFNGFMTNAKIISLPETKSIKEKLKGTCVLNESVEFKEGEIVEYCYWQHLGRKGWKECRYTGGKTKDGLFVVECDGEFVASPEIRKIDQDPHGFLKTANEIISERIQHKPFHEDSVRDMLIEAMKRVKK
jgi:hypothetical protein